MYGTYAEQGQGQGQNRFMQRRRGGPLADILKSPGYLSRPDRCRTRYHSSLSASPTTKSSASHVGCLARRGNRISTASRGSAKYPCQTSYRPHSFALVAAFQTSLHVPICEDDESTPDPTSYMLHRCIGSRIQDYTHIRKPLSRCTEDEAVHCKSPPEDA